MYEIWKKMLTTNAVFLFAAVVLFSGGCTAPLLQTTKNLVNPIMKNICRLHSNSNPQAGLAPHVLPYVPTNQRMYQPIYGHPYHAAHRPMYGRPHHFYTPLPHPYQSVAIAPHHIYFFRGHEVLVTGLDGMLQQRVPIRWFFPGGPNQVNAAFYNHQLNNMMLYDCHWEYRYQLTPNGFVLVQRSEFMPSRINALRGMVEIQPGHPLLYYKNDMCRQYDPLRNKVVMYTPAPLPPLHKQLPGLPENVVAAIPTGTNRLSLFTNHNSYVYDTNANQIVCGPMLIDDFIHTPPPPHANGFVPNSFPVVPHDGSQTATKEDESQPPP